MVHSHVSPQWVSDIGCKPKVVGAQKEEPSVSGVHAIMGIELAVYDAIPQELGARYRRRNTLQS